MVWFCHNTDVLSMTSRIGCFPLVNSTQMTCPQEVVSLPWVLTLWTQSCWSFQQGDWSWEQGQNNPSSRSYVSLDEIPQLTCQMKDAVAHYNLIKHQMISSILLQSYLTVPIMPAALFHVQKPDFCEQPFRLMLTTANAKLQGFLSPETNQYMLTVWWSASPKEEVDLNWYECLKYLHSTTWRYRTVRWCFPLPSLTLAIVAIVFPSYSEPC